MPSDTCVFLPILLPIAAPKPSSISDFFSSPIPSPFLLFNNELVRIPFRDFLMEMAVFNLKKPLLNSFNNDKITRVSFKALFTALSSPILEEKTEALNLETLKLALFSDTSKILKRRATWSVRENIPPKNYSAMFFLTASESDYANYGPNTMHNYIIKTLQVNPQASAEPEMNKKCRYSDSFFGLDNCARVDTGADEGEGYKYTKSTHENTLNVTFDDIFGSDISSSDDENIVEKRELRVQKHQTFQKKYTASRGEFPNNELPKKTRKPPKNRTNNEPILEPKKIPEPVPPKNPGDLALENELIWDRHPDLKILYAKKEYLSAGLYSGYLNKEPGESSQIENLISENASVAQAPARFKFPKLMYHGISVIEQESDFTLPFDMLRFVNVISGGYFVPKPEIQSVGRSKPPKFMHIAKSSGYLLLDIYVDRKPNKLLDLPQCNCSTGPEKILGCGDNCLNRCTFIECLEEYCVNGVNCSNQRFQRNEMAKDLEVCWTNGRGFGLRTNSLIAKNSLVIEYRGEIISQETCIDRMNTIYAGSENYYMLDYDKGEVLDAGRKGTDARFVNHCCEPNCRIEKWSVYGEFRVGLFSNREIKEGEELTYDYKFQSFGPMKKCLCGAGKCRGFIGRNKKVDSLQDIKNLKLAASGDFSTRLIDDCTKSDLVFFRKRGNLSDSGGLPFSTIIIEGNPFEAGVNLSLMRPECMMDALKLLFRNSIHDSYSCPTVISVFLRRNLLASWPVGWKSHLELGNKIPSSSKVLLKRNLGNQKPRQKIVCFDLMLHLQNNGNARILAEKNAEIKRGLIARRRRSINEIYT